MSMLPEAVTLAELSGPQTALWAVVAGVVLAGCGWLWRAGRSPKQTIDNKPDEPVPVDVVRRSADPEPHQLGEIAQAILAIMGPAARPVALEVVHPNDSHRYVQFRGIEYGRTDESEAAAWLLAVAELVCSGDIKKRESFTTHSTFRVESYMVTDQGVVKGNRLPKPII